MVNVPFVVWWLVDVVGGGGFLVPKFHKTRPGSNTCVPLLEHPNITEHYSSSFMFSILKFAFAIIFSNSNGSAFVYNVIYNLSKDTTLMEIYVLHHKRFVFKRLTHYEICNLVNFAVESSIAWRMRNLMPISFGIFVLSFALFLI